MFSYRHAFHAGNHADVLKHTVLVAVLQHLTEKEAALLVLDTHAGAGLYRLDGDYAHTSGEAADGIARLLQAQAQGQVLAPALQDYVELVQGFNAAAATKIYPGSPFIAQRLLRPHDRLKLFELHPTDHRLLAGNVAQLEAGRQVAVALEDGFEGVKKFLPPPARRALLLCDPSYEIKSDYARVPAMVQDALLRFATGCYAIWYPIVGRQEAHDLPRRLKRACAAAGKDWLHATLNIGTGDENEPVSPKLRLSRSNTGRYVPVAANKVHTGLRESGMFIVNPPFVLAEQLKTALPQLKEALGQGSSAAYLLEASA